MASVWRATDTVLGRDVAVKFLHEHLARDPGFVERFRREALSAARLTIRTSSTCSTPASSTACPTSSWSCSPAATCPTSWNAGPLEPDQAVDVGMQVLAALRAAHADGVITAT